MQCYNDALVGYVIDTVSLSIRLFVHHQDYVKSFQEICMKLCLIMDYCLMIHVIQAAIFDFWRY